MVKAQHSGLWVLRMLGLSIKRLSFGFSGLIML